MTGKSNMVSVFVGDNALSIQKSYYLRHLPPLPPSLAPPCLCSLNFSLVKEK